MPAMLLRGGIVGLNFVLILGLAAVLGLDVFGAVAVIWGVSLVTATILSCGGPLLLLRAMTDGGRLHWHVLLMQAVVYPAVLALGVGVILGALWPSLPWVPILMAGFLINLLSCLASIMRALGSIQMSMGLRDAAPQIALFIGALSSDATEAASILMHASIVIGIICIGFVLWCIRHPKRGAHIGPDGRHLRPSAALWGTSVLGMVLAQVDIIIGGSLLSAEQIGLYAMLRRIANLVALPVTVATWVSAGPISAAHGMADTHALQQASRAGSRIALIPGAILFVLAIALIPVLDRVTPNTPVGQGHWVFVVLLIGAFIQVFFASGFTVATLCDQAHLAAKARLISVFTYVMAIGLAGASLTPMVNACAYVAGISLGSFVLWQILRQRLRLDTSAAALWHRRGAGWKLS